MVKAAAVLCEICRSGNNRGRVVLFSCVVVRRVEDVVEDVLLHLPDLGVPVDPSLVENVRHFVKVFCPSFSESHKKMTQAQVQIDPNGICPISQLRFPMKTCDLVSEKRDKDHLDIALVLLSARVEVILDAVIAALLDDLLGLLAGEEQVPDDSESPVQVVFVVLVVFRSSGIPSLGREGQFDTSRINMFVLRKCLIIYQTDSAEIQKYGETPPRPVSLERTHS